MRRPWNCLQDALVKRTGLLGNLIVMEFGLTHEQQLVVDTVRNFVEKEFYPLEDEIDRTGLVPGALGPGSGSFFI